MSAELTIKRLALEADEHCRDNVPNWTMDDYNLKFAQLIVQECCHIMVEHSHRPAGVVKRNVKEHFGVEQ